MALSADRKLDIRQAVPVEYGYYVQAGAQVYRGSIVALCSDFSLIPAGTVGTPAAVVLVGIAEQRMGNILTTGLANSLNAPVAVRCRRGSVQCRSTRRRRPAAINTPVYAIDDQTVSLSSSNATRLQLGVLEGFDERGNPWVKV